MARAAVYPCPMATAKAAALTGQHVAIGGMTNAGEIVLGFDPPEHAAAVRSLLKKYAKRNMDLADHVRYPHD